MKISCLILVALCLNQFVVGQASPENTLTLQQRVFTASSIYSLAKFYSASPLPAADLDSAYQQYLQAILSSDDRLQFDLASMAFLARFHNTHTSFWDSWLIKNYGQPLGFYAAMLDGKWVIERSNIPGPRPGDILTKIGDATVEDFFAQQKKYVPASSEAAQRHNFFLLDYLFPEQFILTLADGRKIPIDRAKHKFSLSSSSVEGRWLTPNIVAYVRIGSFANLFFEQTAIGYVKKFQDAKTLIVDLRDNSGGLPPQALLRSLMDQPYHQWRKTVELHLGLLDAFRAKGEVPPMDSLPSLRAYIGPLAEFYAHPQLSWGGEITPPDKNAFHGKLILLVNQGCVSACEDLVQPFKDNHRATLVGETTEGSSGQQYFQSFNNSMVVRISVVRQYFSDGSEFEGMGIKPDIEVRPSIEDLQTGKDVVLQKAIDSAKR